MRTCDDDEWEKAQLYCQPQPHPTSCLRRRGKKKIMKKGHTSPKQPHVLLLLSFPRTSTTLNFFCHNNICTYIYTCACIYICVCVYVCIYQEWNLLRGERGSKKKRKEKRWTPRGLSTTIFYTLLAIHMTHDPCRQDFLKPLVFCSRIVLHAHTSNSVQWSLSARLVVVSVSRHPKHPLRMF